MNSLRILVGTAAVATAVIVTGAGGAVASDPAAGSPPVSPAPAVSPIADPTVTSAAPTTPPVLVTGASPAFSMALPTEWQVGEGEALLQATSPSGASVVLANGTVAPAATFDAYVTAVEKGLEKKAGTDLPTTFRKTGIGIIARIETAGHLARPTSLFLFPVCPDGARTLTLSGAPTAGATPIEPDSWDLLAATVNPCSADAAPAFVVDPAAAALGVQYMALADDWIERMTVAYKPLERSVPVKVWNTQMTKIAAIDLEFMNGVAALPWTPELQPLADAWHGAHEGFQAAYRGMARTKTVRGIDALQRQLDAARPGGVAASAALRTELGLATNAQ